MQIGSKDDQATKKAKGSNDKQVNEVPAQELEGNSSKETFNGVVYRMDDQ